MLTKKNGLWKLKPFFWLLGYLNDEEATKITIDEEGWLHTGDIGYIDDDDQIFIVDRLKELIKYKGFQVAPSELEDMLIVHPKISDAAVVSWVPNLPYNLNFFCLVFSFDTEFNDDVDFSMKDEAAGEVPVAFVVLSNGSKISEEEIKQYISKQVYIVFVLFSSFLL